VSRTAVGKGAVLACPPQAAQAGLFTHRSDQEASLQSEAIHFQANVPPIPLMWQAVDEAILSVKLSIGEPYESASVSTLRKRESEAISS
jgi:hypothetical protein